MITETGAGRVPWRVVCCVTLSFFRPTGRLPGGAPLGERGLFVLAVLVHTVGLWPTVRWHGLPTTVVALFPTSAFPATAVLDRTDGDSQEGALLHRQRLRAGPALTPDSTRF